MKPKIAFALAIAVAVAIALFGGGAPELIRADSHGPGDSTQPPPGVVPERPIYVEGPSLSHAPVIRVYKDTNAWFGENRDTATLSALGKILGDDWFVHPVAACQGGIPAGTDVVFFTSNGFGLASSTAAQNHPACQASLSAFLNAGGVLIVDMGDNDIAGGYQAPGAVGTPTYILGPFDEPTCRDATLAGGALGLDGVLGTADDHPIVKGPDGIPGTADDLNNSNIDMAFTCWVSHGNLVDGITLPLGATVLMTRAGWDPPDGTQKPILAEYCHEGGRVILDTITKEFIAHQPVGTGPTFFLTNLLTYALSPAAKCVEPGLPFGGRACSEPNFICKEVRYFDADGDRFIEVGELVNFFEIIRVKNLTPGNVTNTMVTDNWGAEIDVTSATPSQGTATLKIIGASARESLTWQIGTLGPGAVVDLSVESETDLNPAVRQSYTECSLHEFNSGAVLKFLNPKGKQVSFETGGITVSVLTENAQGDCDGDGFSDADELKAGTDPHDPASFPGPVGCAGAVFDRCIDTDGTVTPGDGFNTPFTAGSPQVFIGAPLSPFPDGPASFSGLDMFDNDFNGAWTFGPPGGDDLHLEDSSQCAGGIRNGVHNPGDCIVLDYDGSLFDGQPVTCDLEFGLSFAAPCPADVKYFDVNGNGSYDDGEDLVLDGNGNGVFD